MPSALTVGRWGRHRLGLLSLLLTCPGFAAADFTVCNDSFDVLNLAVAHDPGTGFVSEGWWTIAPNRCVAVIRDRIDNRYVYVHATDVFNQPVLEGDATFCIDDGRFRIAGPEDCWARGHIAAPFAEVDMGQSENWTLILNLSGRLPTD